MRRLFNQRVGCIFVLIIVVVGSIGMAYHWMSDPAVIAQQIANMGAPTATLPPSASAQTSQLCSAKQRNFEMGVSFPQWSVDGYGGGDNEWLLGLSEMRRETGSCWVEMPLLMYQSSETSTNIVPGNSTPTIASFSYGIRLAHLEGLHVFVTSLLGTGGPSAWAANIKFSTVDQEQQWFQGYWQGFKPYLQAAAQAGAEQFSIGTEEQWLQINAPDSLWNGLIANMHSVFPGALTYDMNWSALPLPLPNWMHNPLLKTIGISAYLPQSPIQEHLSQKQISNLWKTKTLPELDTFAERLGKPIFLSEIGYRATADALYHTWSDTSSAPVDRKEQMMACSVALENLLPDKHIDGTFFWGWTSTNQFNLVGSQAAAAIRSYYQPFQVPQG